MRRSVWIILVSIFTTMLGMGVVAPFLPEYSLSLGASATEVGFIFSSFSISRTFILPFIGNLSDRKGKKRFIVTGLFLYMMVSLIYLRFQSIAGLVMARLLQGICAGLVIPSSMALLGELSPEESLGKFTGLYNTAFFLGLGAGPLIGGMLKRSTGMQGPFIIMGILAMVSFILAYFYLPEGKKYLEKEEGSLRAFFGALKQRDVARLIIFRASYSIGIGLTWTFVPVRLGALGFGDAFIGLLISWIIFFSSMIQTPMGYLSDKMNRNTLILIGGLLNAFCFVVFPSLKGKLSLFALSTAMGLSGGISLPSFNALCVEVGEGKGVGLVMNVVTFFHSLGMIMGPITAGILTDIWGMKIPFILGGIISTLGTLLFYTIKTG